MPRVVRIVVPDYPHHVVQRGRNRQVVFAAATDFERYLGDLRELKEAFGVRVYGYCLMTNHVHLLLGPRDNPLGAELLHESAGRPGDTISQPAGGTFRHVCGKAATSPAWCRLRTTCWLAAGISTEPCASPDGGRAAGLPVVRRAVELVHDSDLLTYR